MNLLDLTEPLFQHVCRLNRAARKAATLDPEAARSVDSAAGSSNREIIAATLDYEAARSEVRELFAEMAEKSRSDHRLAQQYQKIEPALVYFVDSIVAESSLHFATEWNQNRLAFERQLLAGDQRFFDMLDETLAEKGDDAAERLAVFYTCLGLGFLGWFAGQPEMLRRKMAEIAPRISIKRLVESDDSARICPDAYEHTNLIDLPLPVGPRLIGIAIVFCGLILVVFAANIYLFRASSADLSRALAEVAKHDPALKR